MTIKIYGGPEHSSRATTEPFRSRTRFHPIGRDYLSMSHWATCPGVSPNKGGCRAAEPHQTQAQGDSSSYSEPNVLFKQMLANQNLPTPSINYDLFGDLPSMSNSNENSNSHLSVTSNSPSGDKSADDKRHERAIKNRQSAQASRERKRQYVEDLEADRETLQNEARHLRARVGTLESEKTILLTELSTLRNEFEQLKQLVMGRPSDMPRLDALVKEGGIGMHTERLQVPNDAPKAKYMNETLAGLSAQSWVWRGQPAGTLSPSPTTPLVPQHSPSPSGSLLVSVGAQGPVPDQQQPLNHVLRLRLRYRPRSVMRPSTPPDRSNCLIKMSLNRSTRAPPVARISLKRQMCGSVRGKSTLTRTLVGKERLTMMWDQIVSGCVKKMNIRHKKHRK